jgi:hypothetical protein
VEVAFPVRAHGSHCGGGQGARQVRVGAAVQHTQAPQGGQGKRQGLQRVAGQQQRLQAREGRHLWRQLRHSIVAHVQVPQAGLREQRGGQGGQPVTRHAQAHKVAEVPGDGAQTAQPIPACIHGQRRSGKPAQARPHRRHVRQGGQGRNGGGVQPGGARAACPTQRHQHLHVTVRQAAARQIPQRHCGRGGGRCRGVGGGGGGGKQGQPQRGGEQSAAPGAQRPLGQRQRRGRHHVVGTGAVASAAR